MRAGILWTLYSTVAHNSFNNSKSVSNLFSEMFPDPQIAEKFAYGCTQMKYLVTFGIAEEFSKKYLVTFGQIKNTKHVVVLFDESCSEK